MTALEMVDRFAELKLQPVTLALAKARRQEPRDELRIAVLEEVVVERAGQVAEMLMLARAESSEPSKRQRKRGRSLASFYAEAIASEDPCCV